LLPLSTIYHAQYVQGRMAISDVHDGEGRFPTKQERRQD
jgi:hypothetical protein